MDAKIVRKENAIRSVFKRGRISWSDILNIMEAHVSLMELENVRILKGDEKRSEPKGEL